MLGRILLEKELLVDPVGIALQGEGLPSQMRYQHRRYARVIVNDLTFGKAGFRVEDLVQVRQLEEPATNFDILTGRQGRIKKFSNWEIEKLGNQRTAIERR